MSHAFIATSDYNVDKARTSHKAAKKSKNIAKDRLLLYIDSLNSGQLTQSEFSAITVKLSAEYKTLKKDSADKFKTLTKAKSKAKVLFFKNLNVFAFQVGIFSILFIYSFIFYTKGRRITEPHELRAHKWQSVLFMSIASYYLVWVFYPYSDMPRWAHLSALMLIGFIFSTFAISFIDWKYQEKRIIDAYKDNIKIMFRFIAKTAKNYVEPSKKRQYEHKYMTDIIDNINLPKK